MKGQLKVNFKPSTKIVHTHIYDNFATHLECKREGEKTEFGASNYMDRKAKNPTFHMKLKEDTMKFLLQFYDY
jgi:hypothetical protein